MFYHDQMSKPSAKILVLLFQVVLNRIPINWTGINNMIWSDSCLQNRLCLEESTGITGLSSQAGERLFWLTAYVNSFCAGSLAKGFRETVCLLSFIFYICYIYTQRALHVLACSFLSQSWSSHSVCEQPWLRRGISDLV